MKRSKVTKLFALLLVFIMALSACSKGDDASTSTSEKSSNASSESKSETGSEATEEGAVDFEPTTINIRLMNEFNDMEKVIAEYKERTKDDPIMSKIDLNITYVPGGDYKDKLTLLINGQEDYDLFFTGSWHGFNGFANNGVYADISSYFNNDEFPGLKAAFSEDYIDAAKTFVKNENGEFESKLFCIPLAEALNDTRGLLYREDLRVKYDIPEITSDAILMDYLEAIKENEPDMIPWSMYNGFFYNGTEYYTGAQNNVFWQEIVGQEAPFYVALNDDATEVINAVTMGDDASEFAGLPSGYNSDFITAYHVDHLKWADYLSETRATGEEEVGTPAVMYAPLTQWQSQQSALQEDTDLLAEYPDASYRFYVTEESQRNQEAGAIVSEMKSNNFLTVPEWSENIDAVMYFLDWMYGTQENHDLFQFGIEGFHWEQIGSDSYRVIEQSEAETYKVPFYSFTWNPSYIRYSEVVANNPEIKAMFDYQNNLDSYSKSPLAGFSFDPTNVQTEVANVTALSELLQLRFAVYGDDTVDTINTWHADATDVGLDAVRDELIAQVQAFLDMKNK